MTPKRPPKPNTIHDLLRLLFLVSFLRVESGTRVAGSAFVGDGSRDGSVEDSPRRRRLRDDISPEEVCWHVGLACCTSWRQIEPTSSSARQAKEQALVYGRRNGSACPVNRSAER